MLQEHSMGPLCSGQVKSHRFPTWKRAGGDVWVNGLSNKAYKDFNIFPLEYWELCAKVTLLAEAKSMVLTPVRVQELWSFPLFLSVHFASHSPLQGEYQVSPNTPSNGLRWAGTSGSETHPSSLCVGPQESGEDPPAPAVPLHQQNTWICPSKKRKGCLVGKHCKEWGKVAGTRARAWHQGLWAEDGVCLEACLSVPAPVGDWLPVPCSLPTESLQIRLLAQASCTCSQAITLLSLHCSSAGSADEVYGKKGILRQKKKKEWLMILVL